MPTPTIPDGKLFMNATTYTGNGTYPTTITNGGAGTSFQPDLVWMKARSIAYDNVLYDSVRGTGTGASLVSNSTSAEGAGSVNANMSAFTSNGFTIGSTSSTNILNASGQTFVGWQWKAGGAAVTNTAGSISSQVSANTTSGFSVVTYTANGAAAQTIGHGLGVAPVMVITKCRSAGSSNWGVYHRSIGNTGAVFLNTTDSTATSSLFWNNTTPTSTVFSVGTNNTDTNFSTNTMVAYCFAEIAGYSAFGSYTGNGSADGPFVYLGFRPRFVMWKRTDASSGNGWYVLDSARSTTNVMGERLFPNLSNAGSVDTQVDFLSNGFKLRTTDTDSNASGGTYIYMAFAENPFKYANAR